MESIFAEITIIICLAAVLSILFRMLKQPAILAYILTGILLGPLGLIHLQNGAALKTLGDLGVTLLLFMLGLELKLNQLKSIGKTALIAGSLQMYFTFIAGFFLARVFGVAAMAAVFVGLSLAFSSTIVIVKMLSDKKDLNSLHGKIAVGILLMQDFFAICAIIIFTSMKPGMSPVLALPLVLQLGVKVILLFASTLFLSKTIFPTILHRVGRSQESLFLFSLAWVFALTAFVSSPVIGLSSEIGGFLAGLALANSHENFQIIARMKALRDFFITIFFVMLGLQMTFRDIGAVILPIIILSLFVLFAKPIIVMCITGMMGYRKRTSFFVGVSLGQVSEFSLILLFLGNSIGYVSNTLVTLLVLVTMLSFLVSSYLMQYKNKIYQQVRHFLSVFESHDHHTESNFSDVSALVDLDDHVVVIGGEAMGRSIVHALRNAKEKLVVVDFNPDVITKLQEEKVLSLFGDIVDSEIQEHTKLHKAKLVISTIPDMEDNMLLIENLNHMNRRAKVIVVAIDGEDAKALYKKGADYVVMPHLAGGQHLARILKENLLENIHELKEKDMKVLSS